MLSRLGSSGRFAAGTAIIAIAALGFAVPAWASSPNPTPCDPTSGVCCNQNGICTVGVGTDAGPGSAPSSGPGSGGFRGGGSAPVCTWQFTTSMPPGDPTLDPVSRALQYTANFNTYETWLASNPRGTLYLKTCPGTGSALVYVPVGTPPPPGVPPTPGQVAQQALASLTLPKPTTSRGLAATLPDDRPYVLVEASTWFWTDPATYHTYSATAAVAGAQATVTVTPVALTFTPGDGAATVSCAGPGTPWTSGKVEWVASPSGCSYSYPHSTYGYPNNEQLTATWGIVWQVSWTGAGGAAGTLADITTSSTSTFAVAQAEAVVTK